MAKIYIAGPMTGIEDNNFSTFNAVANLLRNMGHEPVNPAEMSELAKATGDYNHNLRKYLRRDLLALLECDAVVLLPEWAQSTGASIERAVALSAGIPTFVIKPEPSGHLGDDFLEIILNLHRFDHDRAQVDNLELFIKHAENSRVRNLALPRFWVDTDYATEEPGGLLIGFAGQAGTGKDYSYETIKKLFQGIEIPVRRVAFADEVRFEIQKALLTDNDRIDLGTDLEALWAKPYSDSIRRLQQWWATEYRRAQNPDYWVDKTREKIRQVFIRWPNAIVCVTDIRFANEAAMISAFPQNNIVVILEASTTVRLKRLGGQLPQPHASEDMDFEADASMGSDSVGKSTSHPLNVLLGKRLPGLWK